MDTWICHAKPAQSGGVPCRTVNAMDALTCEVCGCTRKASRDREMHARDDALLHSTHSIARLRRGRE